MDLHGVLAHSKSVEVEELWRQQQRQREELEQLHSAHQRKVSELQLTEITQSQPDWEFDAQTKLHFLSSYIFKPYI